MKQQEVRIHTKKDGTYMTCEEGSGGIVPGQGVALKMTFQDALQMAFLTLRLGMEPGTRKENALDSLRTARRIFEASSK